MAALENLGFLVVALKAAITFLRHEDGWSTVVPMHSGETIGPGLLHKILRDGQLTADQLGKLLQKRKILGNTQHQVIHAAALSANR